MSLAEYREYELRLIRKAAMTIEQRIEALEAKYLLADERFDKIVAHATASHWTLAIGGVLVLAAVWFGWTLRGWL